MVWLFWERRTNSIRRFAFNENEHGAGQTIHAHYAIVRQVCCLGYFYYEMNTRVQFPAMVLHGTDQRYMARVAYARR